METTKGHGARSAAVHDRAVLALLTTTTLAAAAERAGVHPATLRQWLAADESFKAKLKAGREAVFADALLRIGGLAGQAVETLATLMEDGRPPGVRLGAAKSVLELALYRHEAEAIEMRLNDLEQHLRGEVA